MPEATVRPVRPGDEHALRTFCDGLSAGTRAITDELMRFYARADQRHHIGFVAA